MSSRFACSSARQPPEVTRNRDSMPKRSRCSTGALDMYEHVVGNDHPDVGRTRNNRGIVPVGAMFPCNGVSGTSARTS